MRRPTRTRTRHVTVVLNVLLTVFPQLALAQVISSLDSPVGVWRTIDDKTRQPHGLVRVFERNGELVATIETSFDPKELNDICDKCPGERKNKKVIGMEIMRGMRKKGNEYSGGEILDPDTGSIYKCRMTLEAGGKQLVVRGFIGISLVGRSQIWYREK